MSLQSQGRMVPHLARVTFFVACLSFQAWLLLDVPIKAAWIPGFGCVITHINSSFSNIGRTYNTGYFLVLLAFASWDYARTLNAVVRPSTVSLKELCWFGVAFLASCTNVVFIWIRLNPVMAVITTTPTTIVISVASGRVIRLWNYSVQAPMLPETTEPSSQSPRTRSRFSFRTWELALGRRTHEAMEDSTFQRLDSAPASQTGSYLGAPDSMRAANSTRPSSIILPSLIAPSSTYSPNRASQGPSTHLDSASEASDRGDRYDLDAQLAAARQRSL
ncbi:hypothetical protein PTI98_003773 [Pleurotus ostreatus]|nr:hypothetical protein PTI98_003773 [Pleurotus ostreatus]